MSGLKQLLLAQIALDGPLSLSDYMSSCLLHPEHGYYTRRDPLGEAGDFTTAPEISQMFGELVGLSLAQSWLDQGAPKLFTLAELGPGRGTLMADVLRVGAKMPGFSEAAQVVMVEQSPALKQRQRQVLSTYDVRWIDEVSALPEAPLWCMANEFFDALPIRQFQRSGADWSEVRVGAEGDSLIFGLAGSAPQPGLKHRLADTRDGDVVEIAPAASAIVSEIGRRIVDHGGSALFVDYGDWRSLGDTLQAMAAHQRAKPLEAPGTVDLTAHVDFEALATAAPCAHTKLTPQGVFLERLGITARARALAAKLTGAALDTHIAAHRRLTHPKEMGTLFKVMGLMPAGAPPWPGLVE